MKKGQPTETKIVELAIDKITPHPKNPKKHFDEAIERSIKSKGYIELIVVDEKNQLLAGEGRWRALTRLGYKKIKAVQKTGLSEKEKLEYLLASNKISERGGWDMDILKTFDRDILLLGQFETSVIDKLFRNKMDDDDFDPDAEYAKIENPKTKPGQMYDLGGHRLLCGDATKSEDVKYLMGKFSAQMVFTDPPYNINYQGSKGKRREKILNDQMDSEDYANFLANSIQNMLMVCKGAFCICMSPSGIGLLKDVFERVGGHWQSTIIWAKNTFTLSGADWQNQYEPILYGWHGEIKDHFFAGFRDEGNVWEGIEKLKPKMEDGKTMIKVGEYHLELDGQVTGRICVKKEMTDLWREKKPSKSTDHPTMKPVRLVAKAIRGSSMDGDIVLDPFARSGSTMVAAQEMNRRAYMIELDPRFCDVIVKRFEELTGQKAKRI